MKKQTIVSGFLTLAANCMFAQFSSTSPGGTSNQYLNAYASVKDHIIFNSQYGVINWGGSGVGDLILRTLGSQGNNLVSWTDRVTIRNNGYVGIGNKYGGGTMDAANDQLHIFSTGSANGITITNASTTNRSAITLENTSSSKKYILGTTGSADGSGSGAFVIKDGDYGDRLNILNTTGFVGIGNANPLHRLSVAGNIAFTGGLVSRAANATIYWGDGSTGDLTFNTVTAPEVLGGASTKMRIAQSGNVIIGNISGPNNTEMLDVAGNISVRGTHVLFNSSDGVVDWGSASGGDLHFRTLSSQGVIAGYTERMIIKNNGSVVIGDPAVTTVPAGNNYKLYVQTGILTEKVKVALTSTSDWADYVFDKNYNLKTMEDVAGFISKNQHLPGIPSAQELKDQGGFDLGKMDAKLLEKIEELTLYIIQLNEKNKILNDRISQLEASR
jgi:hypothetical protein